MCDHRPMVTSARFKKLCLSLEGTTEVPHVDRLAYRTPRKIFATLPPDGRTANLLLVPDLQAAIVEAMPHAFQPVPGGWGRMGFTTVDLAKVDEADLVKVLREAHALASEPPRRNRPPVKPPPKPSTARQSSTPTPRTKPTPASKRRR